jgi:hypothetical protein
MSFDPSCYQRLGLMLSLRPNVMLEAELQQILNFFEDFLEITLTRET